MIALLVIALGDCQIRPYRNAPVPWQEPAVPAKAGKDLSFIDPISVSLNGSVHPGTLRRPACNTGALQLCAPTQDRGSEQGEEVLDKP